MNDKRRIRCICILYAREFKSRKSTVWAFFQGKRRLIDKRNLNFRKATERVGIFLNRITYRDCIFLIIKLALSHRIVIRCCPILRKNLYLVFNQMPWKFQICHIFFCMHLSYQSGQSQCDTHCDMDGKNVSINLSNRRCAFYHYK